MPYPVIITERQVKELLDWDELIKVTEEVLVLLSEGPCGGVVQPLRTVMELPETNGKVITMPGYSALHGALTTKVISIFPDNVKKNLPSHVAKIFHFDDKTGVLKAIIDGEGITGKRTAAASLVATKALLEKTPEVLTIIGCGTQGYAHAEVFTRTFNFTSIRLWNRTITRAKDLAYKLKKEGINAQVFDSVQEAVDSADVICIATCSKIPILYDGWVKEGAIINAVGAPFSGESEIDKEVFLKSSIVADCKYAAKMESGDIQNAKVEIYANIGEIISGTKLRIPGKTVIFKSQGIGVEDAVSSKLVYDKFMRSVQ